MSDLNMTSVKRNKASVKYKGKANKNLITFQSFLTNNVIMYLKGDKSGQLCFKPLGYKL